VALDMERMICSSRTGCTRSPQGVECIDLPPLGMDNSHTVVSRDAGIDVQAARAERRRLIDGAVRTAELLSQLVARQVQQEPVLEEPARLRAPV
jgi:hypothetical protein